MKPNTAKAVAQASQRVLRQCSRLVPQRLRAHLDSRLFYAIFQVSRVTNDHYPTASDTE
ncbi:MAG: hypothetical protein VX519_06160 [Myxococcota bacterium]|nr:hypothetical protein [Myxococcota bacterium]